MREQAIALCRISSISQSDGHSLEAQEKSTQLMASEMEVEIVKTWSVIHSSKKGVNKRRDLAEIQTFCRKNRAVKYLLVDKVNRMGRDWKVMLVYSINLEDLGVKVIYCDPSQRYLNGNDQMTQLLRIIESFKAEDENKERAETTISRMKSRYSDGYYLSKPHAGYKRSTIPGLHIRDESKFRLLQEGSRLIIYKQHTPEQAVKWMNINGYLTQGGKKLTTDHYIEFIDDSYYCGMITVKSDGWPKDIPGKHEAMFSKREHAQLITIIRKRNPRIRIKHNTEFPMANILRHKECEGLGGCEKFAGHHHNRGKKADGSLKPKRAVYDCRDCRKRLNRDDVHEAITDYLNSLEFLPSEQEFKKALIKSWRNQRGTVRHSISGLVGRKEGLEQALRVATAKYSLETEESVKSGLKLLIDGYYNELKSIAEEIANASNKELQSEDFVSFAFDFVQELKKKWWNLSYENMKRGEEILFNEKIYMDKHASVHTPSLSSIYRLGTNKKDLGEVNFNKMVELPVIATGSVGLFWLDFYRLSSF